MSAPGEPVLRVEGLGKRFGSREALRDIGFVARAGEMVAVIGPNGAGKTTLLSILGGVQSPSAGTVSRTGAIGWVPQRPALYSKLSVVENLRLFARLERVADPEAAVARMLEQTGLAARAGERVDRLSGGNRQRVNVALGLLSDPPVILLDEPSSSLDPSQRERLWQFIGQLARRGTSVVFSTHIVAEADRYAAARDGARPGLPAVRRPTGGPRARGRGRGLRSGRRVVPAPSGRAVTGFSASGCPTRVRVRGRPVRGLSVSGCPVRVRVRGRPVRGLSVSGCPVRVRVRGRPVRGLSVSGCPVRVRVRGRPVRGLSVSGCPVRARGVAVR